MNRKKTSVIAAALAGVALFAGCESSADTARQNIALEAEEFKVQRLIIAVNTFDNEVLWTAEGKCSIEIESAIFVICKHGEGDIRSHYMGVSDNVAWFSTQLEGIDVSEYRTSIIFKPEGIVPDFDMETSNDLEGDG